MSIYYKFKGSLSFETKEEAEKQFVKLSSNENGIFWRLKPMPVKGIFLENHKIRIESEGFCGGGSYFDTHELIRESAGFAKSGKVMCYEGDDENDGSYDYILV